MLKDYFTFTRNQSRAIITLIICIVLSFVSYFLMPYLMATKNEVNHHEVQQLMSQIKMHPDENSYGPEQYAPQKLTPFPFDPNTLDSAGFRRLGLREKLVHTLLNYRNKGGKFYNNESLQRIYGLHQDEYQQLEPYITIAKQSNGFEYKRKEIISIELNSADTAQLVKLRGIGSKLSMNIVQYRKQLGGFARVEQLKEVYGISDETYAIIKPSIKINSSLIRKINLNEATLHEINQHPYLRGEIAKAIVDLRKKKMYHLENIVELKEIELINEEFFRKIAPYLSIQ